MHWAKVGTDITIDDILARDQAPYDMDLGVIDIDGQDYWVWSDMTLYAPRVMLVEYAFRNLGDFSPSRGGEGQCERSALVDLGTSKGYRALAATPCNVLFVREDVAKEFDACQ